MFNLNESAYDAKDVKVFNNGVAGIVENVKMRAEEKKIDDDVKAPNLKIIFTDSEGGEINFGLWNINPASENLDKDMKNLGIAAKHLFHTIFGSAYPIPQFKDDVEMLASLKAAINNNSSLRYRVVTNYGSVDYPSIYLRVKKFAPFVENMAVAKEKSKLSNGNKDLMKKPEADSSSETSGSAPTKSWVSESAPEEKAF